jgi:hypothetical protein
MILPASSETIPSKHKWIAANAPAMFQREASLPWEARPNRQNNRARLLLNEIPLKERYPKPTHVPVVRNSADGREIVLMRWAPRPLK